MPRTREERDRVVEARLLNWGRWAREPQGWTPVTWHDPSAEAPVDVLDAQVVERALVRMKAMRPRYFDLVECRYLKLWTIDTCLERLQRSESQFRVDVSKMLSWLDGALDTLDERQRSGVESARP